MSDEKIEKILGNARASLSVEGLEVTEDETKVIHKYLKGDLTEKKVLEIIKNNLCLKAKKPGC